MQMDKLNTDYRIDFDIDDEVTDRFGRTGIVSWYYIWRAGLRYEIEDRDKNWYEYPEYVKAVRSILFNP